MAAEVGGGKPPGEREARQAARSLTADEIPFPRVDLTQTLTVSTIRLAFGDHQDAALFHRWITKGGGWAAFGTYVDERRG